MRITDKQKSVLKRFIKGGLASAFSAMAGITIIVGKNDLSDLVVFLNSLAFAGIVGFATGFVLAAEKYFNWDKQK